MQTGWGGGRGKRGWWVGGWWCLPRTHNTTHNNNHTDAHTQTQTGEWAVRPCMYVCMHHHHGHTPTDSAVRPSAAANRPHTAGPSKPNPGKKRGTRTRAAAAAGGGDGEAKKKKGSAQDMYSLAAGTRGGAGTGAGGCVPGQLLQCRRRETGAPLGLAWRDGCLGVSVRYGDGGALETLGGWR